MSNSTKVLIAIWLFAVIALGVRIAQKGIDPISQDSLHQNERSK